MTENKSKPTTRKHHNKGAIYATHSQEKQLFYKALVDGVLCAAYVKDGTLISYEPWDEVNRQMYNSDVCLTFSTTQNT